MAGWLELKSLAGLSWSVLWLDWMHGICACRGRRIGNSLLFFLVARLGNSEWLFSPQRKSRKGGLGYARWWLVTNEELANLRSQMQKLKHPCVLWLERVRLVSLGLILRNAMPCHANRRPFWLHALH